ncbi:MAG: hypothetical protein NTV73_03395 [Hyphomicrobiales bacterium]|nr:hypothetical protein [Hyphomicrobiales bacterium]
MAAEEQAEPAGPRPTIPFDYLAVAEELHSGRIKVSGDAVAAEYRDSGAAIEAELDALLSDAGVAKSAAPATEMSVEPAIELPVEPETIAVELGLDDAKPADLGRLRRVFALKNHPDRVQPHLRANALKRMQVANGLIDDAKRRALAKARG